MTMPSLLRVRRRHGRAGLFPLAVAVVLALPPAGAAASTGSAESAPDTLDSLAPQVSVVRPDGGETFAAATAETLRWTIAEHSWPTTGEPVRVRVFDGGDVLLDDTVAPDAGGDYSYVWLVPLGVETTAATLRIDAVDRFGWSGTDTGGDFTITDPVTAVPAARLTDALGPVWPNPFNPSTTIAFSLRASARVELAVYDLRGRKLAGLVSGRRDAGRHEVVWLGRDDRGRALPSGTYLARLTIATDDASRTTASLVARLTLVK